MHIPKISFSFALFIYFALLVSAVELPSPYSLPQIPQAGEKQYCASCAKGNHSPDEPGILRESGNMVMSIQLGKCEYFDLGGLLTVRLGYSLPYRPGEYFTIIPPGDSRGNKNSLMIREGEDKLIFKAPSGSMSDLDMTSADAPGRLLKRDGENIQLVNLINKHCYSYETPDYGVTWRLNSIRRIDAPELVVKCIYSKKEGNLEKIILPGEIVYSLSYDKQNMATMVKGADGEYTKIEYDALGGIKTVSTYMPPSHQFATHDGKDKRQRLLGKKDILVRQILAEYDNSGKITSITDGNGNRYFATYSFDADKKNKTVTQETVLTEASGQKRFFQRVKDMKNDTMTTREGRFVQKNPKALAEKVVSRERVLKTLKNSYVLESSTVGNQKTTFEYDKEDTNIKSSHDSSGTPLTNRRYNKFGLLVEIANSGRIAFAREYDDKGMIISETNADGGTKKNKYDASGKIISYTDFTGLNLKYEYSENGTPKKIIYANGDIYELEWDSQLRLTKLKRNDGTSCEWTYKGSLRVPFEYTDHPDGKHPELAFNFKYAYDPQGRLIRTDYYDGTYETWKYNCCNIVEYRNRIGKVTKMAYDANGKLVQLTKTDIGKTQVFYDFAGRKTKIIYPDYKTDTWEYDNKGQIIAETKKDGTKIKRQYTDDGKLKREDFSNGGYRELEYDSKGNIISSKGSNNYRNIYSENGRLLQTEYFETPDFSGAPSGMALFQKPSGSAETASSPATTVADPSSKYVAPYVFLRHDNFFEHITGDKENLYITLMKGIHKANFSLSRIPRGKYNAAKDDAERDTLLKEHKVTSEGLNIMDKPYSSYVNGCIVSNTIFDPQGRKVEQVKFSDGMKNRDIYGIEYTLDNYSFSKVIKTEEQQLPNTN